MASDNTKLNIASQDGGDSIRTILKTAAKTQVVTFDVGGSGAESLISATNGMPVQEVPSSTATITSVSDNASSVQLLAAASGRKGASFQNESTAILYLKCGTTASATSYTVQIPPSGFYELFPLYTGRIDGIWSSAPGSAVRITEFT